MERLLSIMRHKYSCRCLGYILANWVFDLKNTNIAFRGDTNRGISSKYKYYGV